MFTKKFWKDTTERVVSSFAFAVLAVVGADGVNIVEIDWPGTLGIASAAALASLLKAFVASQIGDKESASTVPSVGK